MYTEDLFLRQDVRKHLKERLAMIRKRCEMTPTIAA